MENKYESIGLKATWMHKSLELRNSEKCGKGIFANADLEKGERLAIFGGEIMPLDEILNLPAELQKYPMQIEERFAIWNGRKADWTEDTDYFNHSCDPNAGIRGQIFLTAMRAIHKNEEVVFDYAMVVSEFVDSRFTFEMECQCGSPFCRKKITQQDWKNTELRRKYRGYFSTYLQEKIDKETDITV